jgi:hypothetical protein
VCTNLLWRWLGEGIQSCSKYGVALSPSLFIFAPRKGILAMQRKVNGPRLPQVGALWAGEVELAPAVSLARKASLRLIHLGGGRPALAQPPASPADLASAVPPPSSPKVS